MKTTALAWLAIALASVASASEVRIPSPCQGQTSAFGAIIWKSLRWKPGSLVASVTFSNLEYVTLTEPREDDHFEFAFPGITLDPKTGIFYAHDGKGTNIPVARRTHVLFASTIVLLPGGQIALFKNSGKVTAELIASSEPLPGERWVEHEHEQMLPNF